MFFNEHALKAKGWTAQEIAQLHKVRKKPKHPGIKVLDVGVYWFLLILVIVSNLLIAFRIIPLLIGIENDSVFLLIMLLGAAFGTLFTVLLKDIEMKAAHHVLYILIVIASALISFILIVNQSMFINQFLKVKTHNPWFMGLLYAGFFILPYLFFLVERARKP